MGWPNSERQSKHPLWKTGLGYFGAFEVLQSGWLAAVSAANGTPYLAMRHFTFTFEDSTVECLATGYLVET